MYTLSNQEMWDDELRGSLTAQLANPAVFTAFATTILPPGTLMEPSSLREVVDTDAVVTASEAAQDWAADKASWIRASVRRLGKLARGVNLMGDRSEP